MPEIAARRPPDSDEEVLRRLARLAVLRESGDLHARRAVSGLRALSEELRRPPRSRVRAARPSGAKLGREDRDSW